VKILLGREEVNPDNPDNGGRTPLSYAASGGHEGVAKILLGREEVNPDRLDNDGRTPLSNAASRGHERVVALLQSRKVVTPSTTLRPRRHPLVVFTKFRRVWFLEGKQFYCCEKVEFITCRSHPVCSFLLVYFFFSFSSPPVSVS